MKALARLMVTAVLGSAPGTVWAKGPLVVVELFTAQGCASCRPANALITRLAQKPGVIALTWSVDYWDYLGWKDTFAQADFTARQKAYGHRLGPRDVYTPQVVVDGAGQVSGDDAKGVQALIDRQAHIRRKPPRITAGADGKVRVAAGRAPHGAADVWLVRYDPQPQDVEVKAGDNRGKTLALSNVVRQSVRLGAWRGRPVAFELPAPPEPGLREVVLVETAHGGPVLAALKLRPAAD